MSIIYDALQKIQHSRKSNLNILPPAKKTKSLLYKGVLLGTLVTCVVYSVLPKPELARPILSVKSSTPAVIKPVTVAAKPQATLAHDLVLNGTFITPHNKIALINGRVCNLHDKIQGMTIVAIHEHQVLLKRANGNKMILAMDM